jgi:hypothetical protein
VEGFRWHLCHSLRLGFAELYLLIEPHLSASVECLQCQHRTLQLLAENSDKTMNTKADFVGSVHVCPTMNKQFGHSRVPLQHRPKKWSPTQLRTMKHFDSILTMSFASISAPESRRKDIVSTFPIAHESISGVDWLCAVKHILTSSQRFDCPLGYQQLSGCHKWALCRGLPPNAVQKKDSVK